MNMDCEKWALPECWLKVIGGKELKTMMEIMMLYTKMYFI